MSTNKDLNLNEENKIEEKGIVLKKDLDPINLIVKDNAEWKALLSKQFTDLTKEEKKKLPTAKVRIVSRKNTFANKNQRYIRIVFAEGVYFERQLKNDNGEESLLKIKYPELFEIPKKKGDIAYINVPVRFYSYLKEDGSYTYQFSAELYPGILMRGAGRKIQGTNKVKYYNYFNNMQLELLMLHDTKYKFVLLDSPLNNEDETEEEFED